MRRAHLSWYYPGILGSFVILSYRYRANSVLRDVRPHRAVLILIIYVALRVAWSLTTRRIDRILDYERCGFLRSAVYRLGRVLDCLSL